MLKRVAFRRILIEAATARSIETATPIPEPGSFAFDVFVSWLPDLGLDMGGIGSEGPRLPRLRPAAGWAPSDAEIENSRRNHAARRVWSSQAWFHRDFSGRVDTTTDVSVLEARIRRFEGRRQTRWQPSRLAAVCMSAAADKRLGGLVVIEDGTPSQPGPHAVSPWPVRDADIGEFYGMGFREKTHNGVRYYQQVRPLVARGDAMWSALGRWPWAAFPDQIPIDDWWLHSAALDELQAAHDRAGGGIDLTQRIAAACEVAASFDSSRR